MSFAQEVTLEVLIGDEWRRAGGVSPAEPPGSISVIEPDGRQVVLFGWHEGQAGVWRSKAGVDVENEAVRVVHSLGLELLSDLSEPLEMCHAGDCRIRFTLT